MISVLFGDSNRHQDGLASLEIRPDFQHRPFFHQWRVRRCIEFVCFHGCSSNPRMFSRTDKQSNDSARDGTLCHTLAYLKQRQATLKRTSQIEKWILSLLLTDKRITRKRVLDTYPIRPATVLGVI